MTAAVAAAVAFLARLLGASVRWVDTAPAPGRRVYFANHASHLDFVLIWSALPGALRARTRPVAAADYWTASRPRRYLAERVFRALLVERGGSGVGRLRAQLERMVAALDAGDSLILFPEGTRGAGGGMAPFQGGLYYLARQRPEVALVPVHLHNTQRILPKGEPIPVPLLGRVSFGPPLRLEGGETREDFLARARATVARLEPA